MQFIISRPNIFIFSKCLSAGLFSLCFLSMLYFMKMPLYMSDVEIVLHSLDCSLFQKLCCQKHEVRKVINNAVQLGGGGGKK